MKAKLFGSSFPMAISASAIALLNLGFHNRQAPTSVVRDIKLLSLPISMVKVQTHRIGFSAINTWMTKLVGPNKLSRFLVPLFLPSITLKPPLFWMRFLILIGASSFGLFVMRVGVSPNLVLFFLLPQARFSQLLSDFRCRVFLPGSAHDPRSYSAFWGSSSDFRSSRLRRLRGLRRCPEAGEPSQRSHPQCQAAPMPGRGPRMARERHSGFGTASQREA